jgi:pimeloyl-ACP methyl ester carboxylesterase
MKFRSLAALVAVSATLTACVSSDESTTPSPSVSAGFQAKFAPASGIMPFPNDLYINSTTGQVDIPGDTSVAQNGPLLEQNHLDGFGTQSDINVYFTSSIAKSSINSSDVIVLKVASSASKIIDPTVTPTQLKMGTDFTAEVSPGSDVGGSILTIKPLHPLAASTVDPTTQKAVPATYLVVVTNGLKDTSGNAASPSPDYSKVLAADLPVLSGGKMGSTGDTTLDQVALFTLPQLIAAAGAPAKVDPTKIALSFSFTTEYLGLSLAFLDAGATATTQPAGVGIVDTGETVCDALVAAKQVAAAADCATQVPGSTATEVFAGTVALPYYLTVPAKGSTAALTDSWHNAAGGDTIISTDPAASETPKATVAQNVIPILVAIPLAGGPCTMPGTGWPVVIFQHGITRNREDMLAMASGFGGSCNAVVAIDLPLHGVTDTTDPLYLKGFERTFDMDATGHAGATGKNIDGSGQQFINLNSTITSRDNLREGAADLINLVATLPNLHPVTLPATVYGFDSSQVHFVGHSLGGIIGTTFLGADTEGADLVALATSSAPAPKVLTATLAMPGGHIAELLRNSPAFGPTIDKGLADQGIVKGTQEYYDFYSQAQAVVEDGDPANYAANAAAGHPIHMIEVVGDGTAKNPPDQVVPNSATQVLIDAMGLDKITATTSATSAAGVHGVVQFTAGGHGSILDPTASAAATVEMQTEMVVFAVGNPLVPLPGDGALILISDNSVVKH